MFKTIIILTSFKLFKTQLVFYFNKGLGSISCSLFTPGDLQPS